MFRFIPAATNYSIFGGLGCYVRYKPNKGGSIRVREARPGYCWISAPDRDLVLLRNAGTKAPTNPMSCNYDEYVDFNLFNGDVASRAGLEHVMTNAHHSKTVDPKLRRQRPRRDGEPEIVIDSGGFQLIMQKISYIDPVELVEHYNLNGDVGIVLDIPIVWTCDDALLLRSARAQARNIQKMLKHAAPGLELMNVFHGDKRMNEFRKIVEHPDIKRVAIGGTADGQTIVGSVEMLWRQAQRGMRYKQYHCLGIYSIPHSLPLIYAGNRGPFKDGLLTCDASTPVQSANGKMYHHQQTMTSPPRRLRLGDICTLPSTHNHLPCGCPVCNTLKYTDVLSILDGAMYRHSLAVHNVWEITRYMRMMDQLARSVSFKEYREVCKLQLANSQNKGASLEALDFVHHIEHNGLDSAIKAFQVHRSTNTVYSTPSNLFGEAEIEDNATRDIWIDGVLSKYETDGYTEKSKILTGRKRQEGSQRVARAKQLVGGKSLADLEKRKMVSKLQREKRKRKDQGHD